MRRWLAAAMGELAGGCSGKGGEEGPTHDGGGTCRHLFVSRMAEN